MNIYHVKMTYIHTWNKHVMKWGEKKNKIQPTLCNLKVKIKMLNYKCDIEYVYMHKTLLVISLNLVLITSGIWCSVAVYNILTLSRFLIVCICLWLLLILPLTVIFVQTELVTGCSNTAAFGFSHLSSIMGDESNKQWNLSYTLPLCLSSSHFCFTD